MAQGASAEPPARLLASPPMTRHETQRFPHLLQRPQVAADAFVAPSADLLGDVAVGPEASIWFGCVLRGDVEAIRVGARSNLQDRTVVHSATGGPSTEIGDDVSVGHGCVLHACTLESGAFVGMGAICMDRAVVESGGMLAAGALLPPGKRVPHGELWGGQPARQLRRLRPAELENFAVVVERYVALGRKYLEIRRA